MYVQPSRATPCPPEGGPYIQRKILTQHLCSFVLNSYCRRLESPFQRHDVRFFTEGPNDFHYFTDLMIEWRKCLTPAAETPNMAVAPAAAFPSIVVPLIRMPE
jgi:hypothetical protein